MKANRKFFIFSFIFNFILGGIGFLIFWPIRVFSDNHIAGFIICGIVFTAIAVYINFFIVKRSKLKTPYFIFGALVNIVVFSVFTALVMFI